MDDDSYGAGRNRGDLWLQYCERSVGDGGGKIDATSMVREGRIHRVEEGEIARDIGGRGMRKGVCQGEGGGK